MSKVLVLHVKLWYTFALFLSTYGNRAGRILNRRAHVIDSPKDLLSLPSVVHFESFGKSASAASLDDQLSLPSTMPLSFFVKHLPPESNAFPKDSKQSFRVFKGDEHRKDFHSNSSTSTQTQNHEFRNIKEHDKIEGIQVPYPENAISLRRLEPLPSVKIPFTKQFMSQGSVVNEPNFGAASNFRNFISKDNNIQHFRIREKDRKNPSFTDFSILKPQDIIQNNEISETKLTPNLKNIKLKNLKNSDFKIFLKPASSKISKIPIKNPRKLSQNSQIPKKNFYNNFHGKPKPQSILQKEEIYRDTRISTVPTIIQKMKPSIIQHVGHSIIQRLQPLFIMPNMTEKGSVDKLKNSNQLMQLIQPRGFPKGHKKNKFIFFSKGREKVRKVDKAIEKRENSFKNNFENKSKHANFPQNRFDNASKKNILLSATIKEIHGGQQQPLMQLHFREHQVAKETSERRAKSLPAPNESQNGFTPGIFEGGFKPSEFFKSRGLLLR